MISCNNPGERLLCNFILLFIALARDYVANSSLKTMLLADVHCLIR